MLSVLDPRITPGYVGEDDVALMNGRAVCNKHHVREAPLARAVRDAGEPALRQRFGIKLTPAIAVARSRELPRICHLQHTGRSPAGLVLRGLPPECRTPRQRSANRRTNGRNHENSPPPTGSTRCCIALHLVILADHGSQSMDSTCWMSVT